MQEKRLNLFHLILLDVLLPDGDGFEFFNDIQKKKNLSTTPVIFVTGQANVSDQVLGFSLGAEDYIIKPVYPLILRARVNSKLNKYQALQQEEEIFVLGPLTFDLLKQRITFHSPTEKHEIELTSLEFKLFLYFARREEQIFTRNQIMTSIWGENIHIYDRTIDTHICHLRSKLKGLPFALEAVHGAGYRFMQIK
jgi:DNA-binding response OmpR family regulator